MLTKGNCTRDEWNHLLCLFNISHVSSTVCSEVMSKRTQKESGEERVTAKSSAKAEEYDRTGQPVVGSDPRKAPVHHHKQFVESSYSARYSGWDDDKA